MKSSRVVLLLALVSSLGFSGCDWAPGKPDPSHRWMPASAQKDFAVLYSQNCQACHSLDGKPAPAISMANPLYLSWVPRDTLRQVIREGVKDSAMPAFSEAQGGLLTDEQIDILVAGILAEKPASVPADLPPYAGVKGDAKKGEVLFAAIYAPLGSGVQGFTNPYFLSLVSDSYLRSLLVAGFPESGLPDYSKARPGKVLSNQEISDVAAWLASLRPTPSSQGRP